MDLVFVNPFLKHLSLSDFGIPPLDCWTLSSSLFASLKRLVKQTKSGQPSPVSESLFE